ncbi:MAG: hypothetical protein J2P37_09210, partial [Ktedonobacteraceae bacterium]|nr:hypothetical protein [Ktedonobacteraceae bacterium]
MTQEGEDIELLAEVAGLYYEKNYNQDQIARIVGTSRSGVSRLLTRARELGLVDIHVRHQIPASPVLGDELIKQFGLLDAHVLLRSGSSDLMAANAGERAASYLERYIQRSQKMERPVQTVGVSWGKTVLELIRALRPRHRLLLDVVQMMGSVDLTKMFEVDASELTRRFADAYGARCHYLRAPLFVGSRLVRNGLLKESSLRRAFQLMKRLDVALVGIGGLNDGAPSLFHTPYLKEHQDVVRLLLEQRAAGDICGNYFTLAGKPCATDMLDRLVAISLEVLYEVPLVIGLAVGEARAPAVLGALRTGVVKVLVTDELCA